MSSDFSFEFNVEELAKRLEVSADRVRAEAPAALYEHAEAVMADSKEHYVPVDEGVLRGSGHVQPPVVTGAETSITMGYGAPAAPYALVQHERPDFEHGHGFWKYLETPFLNAVPDFVARLARRLREKL